MNPRVQRWLRFLLGGCLNSALAYGVYLALVRVMEYQLAYFIVYVLGIVFSYCFNAIFVFKAPLSWKGLFAYPLVYVIQYGVSAMGLGSLVEIFGISETLAPPFIIVAMVPLTYALSKFVIKRTSVPKSTNDDNLNHN
jgi:putative flippase GtrA